MAFGVVAKHRDLFRGIVTVDGPLPRMREIPSGEPNNPLAVYTIVAAKGKSAKAVAAGNKRLRSGGVPSTEVKHEDEPRAITSKEREAIARWIDTLDRL